jgi:sterol desaturase/sphingolipid hydroxylase (fatty acid hydroxylase superfamily)
VPLFESTNFFWLFFVGALIFLLRGLFLTEGAIFLRMSNWGRSHLISLVDVRRSHWVHDAKHFVLVSLIDAFVYVFFLKQGWIRLEEGGWQSFLWSFAFMFFWSELWFYFVHRALHSPVLFRIHRVHHMSTQPNPFTAHAFSTSERIIFLVGTLGAAAFVSQFRPLSLAGIVAYVFLSALGLIIEHSHVEVFSKQFRTSLVGRWIVSPSDHSVHHAHPSVNFGLFTKFFDQWLKTGPR